MLTSMSRQTRSAAWVDDRNHSYVRWLAKIPRAGLGLAWVTNLAIGSLLLTSAAGCLVTDKITFPTEQDFPPSIVSGDPPIGRIIWINKLLFAQGWTMKATIVDQNVDQLLKARYRLVQVGEPAPIFEEITVPMPMAGDSKRDLSFTVQSDRLLTSRCDRLDLAVSGSFPNNMRPDQFDFSRVEDDIAEASWTIWEGLGDVETSKLDKQMIADTCPDTVTLKPNTTTGSMTGT
jgi:hypothetical protein